MPTWAHFFLGSVNHHVQDLLIFCKQEAAALPVHGMFMLPSRESRSSLVQIKKKEKVLPFNSSYLFFLCVKIVLFQGYGYLNTFTSFRGSSIPMTALWHIKDLRIQWSDVICFPQFGLMARVWGFCRGVKFWLWQFQSSSMKALPVAYLESMLCKFVFILLLLF